MGMVFNITFNNISAISWWSVLLVKETSENHCPVASHWQTLSHNVVSSIPRLSGIRTHNGARFSYQLWDAHKRKVHVYLLKLRGEYRNNS
jgi:hypothetical protein